MSPQEMMSKFKNVRGDSEIRFGLETPELSLKVGLSDKVAADLLAWMSEQYPRLSREETLDILRSAEWWVIFFGSVKNTPAAP
jgi:hypothetical protein